MGHDFGFSVWHERCSGVADVERRRRDRVCFVRGDLFREILRDDGDNESVSGGDIDRVYDVDWSDSSARWCRVRYRYGYD